MGTAFAEYDPDRRWGYRQVMALLHGDLSVVSVDRYQRRASRPYPGFPKSRERHPV